MQSLRLVLVLSVVACVVGCASINSAFTGDEQKVPLSSVPKAVTDTAGAMLKGFTATKASVEKHDGRTLYELKGNADGEAYELKITAEGKILRLKRDEERD